MTDPHPSHPLPTLSARILLADDDVNFQKVTAYLLEKTGAQVTTAGDGREALRLIESDGPFDAILSDVRMPGLDGLGLLTEVRARDRAAPFILITAHGDIEMAVAAMQAGATDFITKPFERESLFAKLDRALRLPRLERENRELRAELAGRHSFESLIGSSPAMRQLTDLMRRVAGRDTTLLILGESGTGKEVVARALHYGGPRAAGRFVAVNCAAIPPALLESELFGHVRGAFTGADRAREGRFVAASGGTLFLDEIGDMPLDLQAKMLRVLQERRVEPVGSSQSVAVDVRILAATHRDLTALVREGEFREDLYYRLNVVALQIPPLRDRREDIPLLVQHFLARFGAPEVRLDRAALEALSRRDWPGNVRELENAVERALALRTDPARITLDDFQFREPAPRAESDAPLFAIPDEGIVLDDVERRLIVAALEKTGQNQTRAAQLLGISRQKLIYRMQKHGLG